jgi:lipoyl(octanoyl) transferase
MSERPLRAAWLGTIDYTSALELQEALVRARTHDEIGDTLLLLEHPHVYTLGRGADERFIVAPLAGVPIHRVSRGGQVTYHGPGQLVGYPILKLEGTARDVHRYLRMLEETVIDALARYEIAGERRDNLTGVWVDGRKIGSIGVGIRRWVTLHGFALNVTTDLSYFNAIVPCGIEGCAMTSVAALGREGVTVAEFARQMSSSFASVFGYAKVEHDAGAKVLSMIDQAGASHQA